MQPSLLEIVTNCGSHEASDRLLRAQHAQLLTWPAPLYPGRPELADKAASVNRRSKPKRNFKEALNSTETNATSFFLHYLFYFCIIIFVSLFFISPIFLFPSLTLVFLSCFLLYNCFLIVCLSSSSFFFLPFHNIFLPLFFYNGFLPLPPPPKKSLRHSLLESHRRRKRTLGSEHLHGVGEGTGYAQSGTWLQAKE